MRLVKGTNPYYHDAYLVLTYKEYIEQVLLRHGETLEDVQTMWIQGLFVDFDSVLLSEAYTCRNIYMKEPPNTDSWLPYSWRINEAYIWTKKYCYISCEYDGHIFLEPVPLKPENLLEEYPLYGGG